MNHFIESQIKNMVTTVAVFEQACALAAMKDDGKIDPAEAKTLAKIKAAAAKFRKELSRC